MLHRRARGEWTVEVPVARDQLEVDRAILDGHLGEGRQCTVQRTARARRRPEAGGVRCRHVRPGSGGYACIPMMAHGETVGILHVANVEPELSKSLLQLAIVTSERVGLALANTRLREPLRLQSIRESRR